VLNQVKLIAEPWDVGEGGYQVGKFPPLWAEWNGKYRDNIRDFWRGMDQELPRFASRFTGSPDLYENTGRRPYASINFITAHDGFTLHDLVSYNEKHNEANNEENQDGGNDNRSWNCGAEGPTDDPEVLALRKRQQRNFLATLFLSQGIPMLLGGDEIGRTQGGNNNAYCQDSEISWFDWDAADLDLLEFTVTLVKFRKEHPVFNRRHWFEGTPCCGQEDISWHTPSGAVMDIDAWNTFYSKSLGIFLNGSGIRFTDFRGNPILDDSFYLMFNAHYEPITFTLPEFARKFNWLVDLDTCRGWFDKEQPLEHMENIEVGPRSLLVLRHVT
jgi:glycogen operon protein